MKEIYGDQTRTPLTDEQRKAKSGELLDRIFNPRPDFSKRVQDIISSLTERERTVLTSRFGLFGTGQSHSTVEIAQEIGRSPRTVQRNLRSALGKLRHPSV